MFLLSSININCQTPQIHFVYPINSMTEVKLRPEIKITTNCKIDSSSITFVFTTFDTSINNTITNPTIILLSKLESDSIPDSLLKKTLTLGSYSIFNDTTLIWSPITELSPKIQYTLIIQNLKGLIPIQGGGYDTVVFDTQQINFTTTDWAHYITDTPFRYNKVYNCADTFWIKFNRTLNNTSNDLQNIIKVKSFDSTDVINDTIFTRHYTDIPLDIWLDQNDNSIIRFKATTSFTPGVNYIANVNTSYLCGDRDKNEENTFTIRAGYKITTNAIINDTVLLDSIQIFPAQGDNYYMANDSIILTAPQKFSNYIFEKWTCSNNSLINNNTNNQIPFSLSCNNLTCLDIKAVYKLNTSIYVTIDSTQGIVYRVYSSNNNGCQYLGSSGVYEVASNDYITLIANGSLDINNYYQFSGFNSNDPLLDGITFNQATVYNNGFDIHIWTIPQIGIIQNCIKYACAEVVDYHCNAKDLSQIATISPQGCYSTGYSSEWRDFTCTIKPQFVALYEICEITTPTQVYHFSPTYNPNDDISTRSTAIFGLMSNCDKPKVTFKIRSKNTPCTLKVYADLNRILELQNPDNQQSGIGLKRDVTIEVTIYNECHNLVAIDYVEGNTATGSTATYTNANLLLGYHVMLRPLINLKEEGFNWRWWDQSSPYIYPSTNWDESNWPNGADANSPFNFYITNPLTEVKGLFIEHFRLRQIGFYQGDDRSNINWKRIRELRVMAPKFVEDVEVYDFANQEETGFKTRIHFRFNDKVESSTLLWNICSDDLSERVDYPSYDRTVGSKFSYLLKDTPNSYRFEVDEDGSIQRRISFDLEDGYYRKIPKGEEFNINVGLTNKGMYPCITNQRRFNLKNPGVFNAETELPAVLWIWKKMKSKTNPNMFCSTFKASTIWYSFIIDDPKIDPSIDFATDWANGLGWSECRTDINSMKTSVYYPEGNTSSDNFVIWNNNHVLKMLKDDIFAYAVFTYDNYKTNYITQKTKDNLASWANFIVGKPFDLFFNWSNGNLIISKTGHKYIWNQQWFGAHPKCKIPEGSVHDDWREIIDETETMQYIQNIELLKKKDMNSLKKTNGIYDTYRDDFPQHK